MPSPLEGHSRAYVFLLFLMFSVVIGLIVLVQVTTPKSGVVPRTTHTFSPTTTSTTAPPTTTWYPTTTTTVPPTTTVTTTTTATTTAPPSTQTTTIPSTTTTHTTTTVPPTTTTTHTTTGTTTVPPTTLPSCMMATQIGQTLSGSAVVIQGSIMAVNAYTVATSVYSFNGSYWVQMGASFGGPTILSLSYDTGTVAINDNANVTMYSYNGSSWVRKGPVIISGLGTVVSMGNSGTTVATGTALTGTTNIFDYSAGNWIQRGIPIQPPNDQFSGTQVSLSADGSTIAIAASYRVRVFRWMNPVWVQLGQILSGGQLLVVSMSENGNSLAIGDPLFNNNNGCFIVYDYGGTNWAQRGATITLSGVNYFGYSVSMSANGNTVAASAAAPAATPFVRIYDDPTGNGAWTLRGAPIVDSAAQRCSLSPEGSRLAIGLGARFIPAAVKAYCV